MQADAGLHALAHYCKSMLIVSKVSDLSGGQYRACHRLNMGDKGLMRRRLVRARGEDNSYAFLFVGHDEQGKWQLNGWALTYINFDKEHVAYFYIRKSCRKQGVASQLMEAVLDHHGTVRVCPFNRESALFFAHYYDRVLIEYPSSCKRIMQEKAASLGFDIEAVKIRVDAETVKAR